VSLEDIKSENPQDHERILTKDELNLAEFPFALASHRAPKNVKSISITEMAINKAGQPVQRAWTVLPSAQGLPLPVDEEVFLGLMHFLFRDEFRGRHIDFSQHRLFRLLGWSGNQRDYERLELSLRRLKGSSIECREAFWDNKGKCYATHSFSLIDGFSLYRREDRSSDQPFISRVTFNEVIFESFRSGFIKTLDFGFYRSLKSPLARKLFRLLDKKRYKTDTYEIELMRLASRLALTDNAYPSDVRKQLDRSAHAELKATGFLKAVFYIRRGKTTSVKYEMASKETWRSPQVEKPQAITEDPLVGELVARGITRVVARTLIEKHGEKVIAEKLEVFDHLHSQQSPLLAKNPAGFLRTSIEKDYAPPTGYISRAERQRRKADLEEARRREQEQIAAADKAQLERQSALDAQWNGLSREEQAQLEDEVLLTFNAFTRKIYLQEKASGKIGPGHHALRSGIGQLLQVRHTSASVESTETAV